MTKQTGPIYNVELITEPIAVGGGSPIKQAMPDHESHQRIHELEAVVLWAYQELAAPAAIHDMAARALDEPSLAHGMADDENN